VLLLLLLLWLVLDDVTTVVELSCSSITCQSSR
jgi:hypothetical protein